MEEQRSTNFKLSQNQIIGIIIGFIIILIGVYWISIRPYYIRKDCNISATNSADGGYPNSAFVGSQGYSVSYNGYYQSCLNSHGI